MSICRKRYQFSVVSSWWITTITKTTWRNMMLGVGERIEYDLTCKTAISSSPSNLDVAFVYIWYYSSLRTTEMIISCVRLRCCCCVVVVCWVGNNLGGCAVFCREDARSCLNKRLGPRPSSPYGKTRMSEGQIHKVESPISSPLRDLWLSWADSVLRTSQGFNPCSFIINGSPLSNLRYLGWEFNEIEGELRG